MIRVSVRYLVILICISLNSLFSQNKLDEKNLEETMRNPWKADRSVFLQDWLVLGSFPIKSMDDIDIDFLSDHKGEANVQPVEGQTVSISGNEMKWLSLKCRDVADLQGFYQDQRNQDAVAYAYTKIIRKEPGKVTLMLASDDAIKVWCNGKMVHRLLQLRGINLDDDKIEVDLNAGVNHLLLKIHQAKGGWGYAVRMLDDPNQFNLLTGNIEFTLIKINPIDQTISVISQGTVDQTLLKQTIQMEVYSSGGKTILKKEFNCSDPVVLYYKNWPDGVIEFRFVFNDIRGLRTYKYASWYKGDILKAAQELVNSAPSKEVRTPDGCTHRMLADMILNRLENNLQNLDSTKYRLLHAPLMEFAEFKAKNQVRAGGCLRLAYIDDIDNTPQFCRSYLPLNYNPKKKWPLVVYLHGYNQDNPEYINWWGSDKRHDQSSDKYEVIFIEPHGRGNTQYLGIGDQDVLKCIELAKQKFNVDEDRIYLMGSSMGGFGTWNVATRHPELFAAISPIYGGGDYHVFTPREKLEKMNNWEIYLSDKSSSTAQLEALNNMPILVSHGDRDMSVDVNLSRYLVRMLQRWNYDVRYIEVPEKGHTELGLWDQIIPWFLEHKRNIAPKQVRIRAADLQSASAHWVSVTQKRNPFEFMVVDAEVLNGNIIRIDSKNILEVVLFPGNQLIDYSKPIKVVWNGKILPFNNVQNQKIVLREEEYSPAPIIKTPKIAGPIIDFQNTPYLIVLGTTSQSPQMMKNIQQKAGVMISDWKSAQKFEPRVKNDVEVTEADLKAYSILLFGGPEDNSITKRIFEKIPFQVNKNEISVDGKVFKAQDAVLTAIYPNPYNNERYVGLVVATSSIGMNFFDSHRRDPFQFDYAIVDSRIPLHTIGATNDKILIASGFFNYNWKIDDALLVTGDEKLRAQCAYFVMKNDSIMDIISNSTPAIETLKKYIGTYQVDNGPQLIVFFDNDILKIAQVSNRDFSLPLLAVSNNEFYLKELDISVSFKQDRTTQNYFLVIHEGGQENSSKKIQ